MTGSSHHIAIFGRALAPKAMALAQRAGVRVTTTDSYLRGADLNEFMARERPDAIILRLGEVTDAAMACSPNLKIVAKHGVGYDTIDIEAANRRGVLVTIARGGNTISVAEHALALMLGVARGIAHLDARIRGGHWDKATYLGTELNGKTLGIVGYGAIGHALANICKALGMGVVVYDPALPASVQIYHPRVDTLDELLANADVISLHCPLTPATRNMISTPQLEKMRKGAILINTARGGLIDIEALTEALATGVIGGAGLDTFPAEPPQLSAEMTALTNLVVSPHVGASTVEAGERVGVLAMTLVLDCLAGRPVDSAYVVNDVISGRVA
ncbi:MAG: hydroxyacid dehydrogenase [Sphingobium sp.]|nr:hydroxyacid dehydrogenase [Sphingobium sp.]